MINNKNCAIIVCSCDKNEDLWDMFFYYFKKYWRDCPYPIYLNTEFKKYEDSDFKVKTFQLYPNGDNANWSERLKKHLLKIPELYVLIILDDFFLQDYVNADEISNCIKRMEEDIHIANFIFDPTPGPNIKSEFELYECKGKKAPFRFSLQAGLWRKELLIRYIRDHEGPWQFETWGSIRSRRYKERFFALKPEWKGKVLKYPWGGGTCR